MLQWPLLNDGRAFAFTCNRYEARDQAEEKLVAMDAKSLDKKEQEREKWKQKMAEKVAKEEKKKSKR